MSNQSPLSEPRVVDGDIQLPPGWWSQGPTYLDDLPALPGGLYSLGLVGCSKRKRPTALPLPAAELYAGVLFHHAYQYSTAQHDLTLVLSGRWGLVAPLTLLEPYDYVLPQRQALGRAWAIHVLSQLDPLWRDQTTSLHHVYLYAGKRYVQPLLDIVTRYRLFADVTWHWPVRGLNIQQQARWFADQSAEEPKGT
ncbi:MAG: hypothetical protein KKA73_03380 [Chloroflexi bacterium]|nr:hypothetical protein [Chloroflexota bacterium]MBU1746706.1 hypothetical protein [Chloroflexota bacterium]MBU1877593.1 hypothetical protein [Chloroflexota bacterium]